MSLSWSPFRYCWRLLIYSNLFNSVCLPICGRFADNFLSSIYVLYSFINEANATSANIQLSTITEPTFIYYAVHCFLLHRQYNEPDKFFISSTGGGIPIKIYKWVDRSISCMADYVWINKYDQWIRYSMITSSKFYFAVFHCQWLTYLPFSWKGVSSQVRCEFRVQLSTM